MTRYKIIGGDGQQYGPIPAEELRRWIAEGRLNAQSLIQVDGAVDWKPLGSFAEFADASGSTNAPPLVATPASPTDWSSQILARQTELRLGECLGSGFSFLAANPGFVIGSVLLTWLIKLAMGFIPIVGGIMSLILAGVITGGLYLTCLRKMRSERASFGNIFDGFKLCFVQLMLAGAIARLLSGFGLLFCFLPGIYLMVAWMFALPLVADKRLEFWSAMELSRKVVTRVWFHVLFLLLLVFLPFIAAEILTLLKLGGYVYGTLRDADFDLERWVNSVQPHIAPFFKMVVIWGLVSSAALLISQIIALGALMRAYENLFGERKP